MSLFANTASWALIAGVLTPLLVSVVQQPRWSPRLRAIVSVVASIIVGVVTCAANGSLSHVTTVAGIISLVVVASNTAYKTLWQPTGVAPGIELATSPRSAPAAGQRRNDVAA